MLFAFSFEEVLKRIGVVKSKFRVREYFILRFIMINIYGKFRDWIYKESKSGDEKNMSCTAEDQKS
jgi:hypothetical protein